MKFDLHTHVIISKHIPYETNNLLRMIYTAKKEGLQGFALVDHIHYPGYWKVCELIKEKFPYSKGFYSVSDSFHIMSGAEINVQGDGHLLLLGDLDEIRFIDEKLGLSQGCHPLLDDLLGLISSEIVTIGAHPFRPGCGLVQYKPSQIKSLHAIELNGSDYENTGNVRGFTKVIGMPIVGGSDAHYWPMIGVSQTIFPDCSLDLTTVKMSIVAGQTKAIIKPDAPLKVDICNRFKRKINLLFEAPAINHYDKEFVLS